MVLPVISAYAEPFTVTTNKDIYTGDENAIIVGVVPEDAPEGYAVLIKVTGTGGDECALQNLLPASDNSFVSRPVRLEGCGIGQLTVLAVYADISATSTFTITNSSRAEAGDQMELSLLKNVLLQAQETVSEKLGDLIEAGYIVPEEIAIRYSSGVSEASLALQAIEFGDSAGAKKHIIFAITHFRQVHTALSSERTIYGNAGDQEDGNDTSSLEEMYSRLEEFYYRLEDLAEKNGVDRTGEFDEVASLLARSQQMMEDGDAGGAQDGLGRVDELLESIRAGLFESGNGDLETTAMTNGTESRLDDEARRLLNAADRFGERADRLLNASGAMPEAQARVHEALLYIANGRTSVEQGDYEFARQSLSAAYKLLNEARKILDEGGSGGERDAGTEEGGGSGESGDGNSSGSEDGRDDSGNNNSSKGADDDSGQDAQDSSGKGSEGGNSTESSGDQ